MEPFAGFGSDDEPNQKKMERKKKIKNLVQTPMFKILCVFNIFNWLEYMLSVPSGAGAKV